MTTTHKQLADAVANDPELLTEFVEKMPDLVPEAALSIGGLGGEAPDAAALLTEALTRRPGLEAIVERFAPLWS